MSESVVTKVSGMWNLGKQLPLILTTGIMAVLGTLIVVFGLKGCDRISGQRSVDSVIVADLKAAIDSMKQAFDSAARPSITYVTEVTAGMIIDSAHDCWGSAIILFGRDTMTIDSANSCKGIYRGAKLHRAPLLDSSALVAMKRAADSLKSLLAILTQPSKLPLLSGGESGGSIFGTRAPIGYEFEGGVGTSLPGNMMLAGIGKAWLGRYGITGILRGVVPEFEKSSIDLLVTYKF